jgi:type III pantothenate kinase
MNNTQTILAIDVGNTNLALGLFSGETLQKHWRLSTSHERMGDEFGIQFSQICEHENIPPASFNGIVVSSVVPPLTERVVYACQQYLGQDPLLVSSNLKLNVTIGYDDPTAVGADRIADAVAAKALFSIPACVIDFGTATTFNAINAESEYMGGAILAGIGLSAQALFQRTAKLTTVELKAPPSIIGRNTTHAIQSGLIYGYVALVEGMVARFKEELGQETKIIATGGHVNRISSLTTAIDRVEPWLTLEGLRIIWEMNR